MSTNRRSILVGAAALSALPMAMAIAQTPPQPGSDPAAMPDISGVHTAKQFSMGVIGPAELSLATSRLGVERATNASAKEFANFELTEAIAVTTVLKELGTPVPPMDAKVKALLAKIKTTPNGTAFDQAYISFQVENHEFLRTLAETYLRSSPTSSDMMEMQGRHLATLALATFKEHVIITKGILQRLQA